MKRFTVPTDFNGVKFPFHIYITESIQPFDDQVRWVNDVRGGTVPVEVIDSFHRLYKIAKENNVSFQDLCVYALGTADKDKERQAEIDRRTGTFEQLKKEESEAKDKRPVRHLLARECVALGRLYLAGKKYDKADNLKNDALNRIERDEQGKPRSAEDRALLVIVLELQGQLESATDKPEQAYGTLLQSLELARANNLPRNGGSEFTLGEICTKMRRRTEAASWFWSAAESSHPDAVAKIGELYLDDSRIAAVLPPEFQEKLRKVSEEISVLPIGAASGVGLLAASAGQGLFLAASALIPGRTPISDFQRAKLFPSRLAETWQEYCKAAEVAAKRLQSVQLKELATQYHDLAEAYEAKGRQDDCRKALQKEFDALSQIFKLNAKTASGNARADVAAKIAALCLESKETKAAVEWTERAAESEHVESLLQLADWYAKGINVKVDVKKANHYRYLGHYTRGMRAFRERRYQDALPDLKKICESEEVDAEDHDTLGMCYGKLGRWDEAITAYTRSVELDIKSNAATGHILNLFEALIGAERPEQLLQFVVAVEKKGWKLPKDGERAAKYSALFHGFRAIALRMSGKDSSDAELEMRQITSKPGFKITGWTWGELDQWLKTTKLAPDRKAAVEKIIAELKGTSSR